MFLLLIKNKIHLLKVTLGVGEAEDICECFLQLLETMCNIILVVDGG